MLKNLKSVLIITVVVAVIFIVVIGFLPKKQMPAGEQGQNQNQELAQINNENADLNNNEVIVESPDDKYNGVVIKEENGWKKYRNKGAGVEFRFGDKEDKFVIISDYNKIIIHNIVDLPGNLTSSESISVYIGSIFPKNRDQYNNFREYLEANWRYDPGVFIGGATGLKEIKEIINKNDTVLYKVVAELRGGKEYVFYQTEINNRSFFEIRCLHDENMCQDVLDTFRLTK